MRRLASATAVLLMWLVLAAPASAQSLPELAAADLIERGWWDDSGTLDANEFDELVARYDGQIAFAHTDRSFDVNEDPTLDAAALLAQAILEQVGNGGGEATTVLFSTGTGAAGASTAYPYPGIVVALQSFDTGDVIASFADAAASITDGSAAAVVDEEGTTVAQTSFFASTGFLVVLAVIAGVLGLLSLRTSQRKRRRVVHTAGARDDTKAQLTAMSDLILDLEPRVTIANDPDLKTRFTDASRVYSEVRERAESATTGHEIADIRLDIAKARWRLDVIDAELDGREPPPEPHRRDNSGSAWDSTRGTGGG